MMVPPIVILLSVSILITPMSGCSKQQIDFAEPNSEALDGSFPRNVSMQIAQPVDLRRLTEGMLIGRAQDDEIYDIAFPGDMMPNPDVIAAMGKSAQLVYGIRIAENEPIFMIKLVHFSRSRPLGVSQITATSVDVPPAVHRFAAAMVSRQTVTGGVIEFASFLPFDEPTAGKVLSIIRKSPCNLEVKGTDGFTTFSPGITTRQHGEKMIALYQALKQQPAFVRQLQRSALPFGEFQRALLNAVETNASVPSSTPRRP